MGTQCLPHLHDATMRSNSQTHKKKAIGKSSIRAVLHQSPCLGGCYLHSRVPFGLIAKPSAYAMAARNSVA
jgi:hypothetical protein